MNNNFYLAKGKINISHNILSKKLKKPCILFKKFIVAGIALDQLPFEIHLRRCKSILLHSTKLTKYSQNKSS